MFPQKVGYTDICSSLKHLETTSRTVSLQTMASNKTGKKLSTAMRKITLFPQLFLSGENNWKNNSLS